MNVCIYTTSVEDAKEADGRELECFFFACDFGWVEIWLKWDLATGHRQH